jgi:hypothetical protein
MKTRIPWSRLLTVVGALAMAVGTIDPLEGSLLILPGSGLVALGAFLGSTDRRRVRYWLWSFILITIGIVAMFALSAVGGIGGSTGRSMWWGLVILPYPLGWLMALAGGVVGLVRFCRTRVGKPVKTAAAPGATTGSD